MQDDLGAARKRAEETIRRLGPEIAATRTLGWGAPIESVAGRYSFIVEEVRPLRSKIPDEVPALIFQSRESPPDRMEVAVPFVTEKGGLSARVIASHESSRAHAQLLGDFSSALWFAIGQGSVPHPSDTEALRRVLTGLVGPNLLAVSIN